MLESQAGIAHLIYSVEKRKGNSVLKEVTTLFSCYTRILELFKKYFGRLFLPHKAANMFWLYLLRLFKLLFTSGFC